ncbi:hypothetical protein D3C75_1066040 [compost metagenome]
MNDAQGCIAIFDIIYNNPNRKQVINFIELLVFCRHFLIHTINMLWSSREICFYSHLVKLLCDSGNYGFNKFFPLCSLLAHQIGNTVILLRIQIPKRNILHFPFDRRNTEPVGDGTKNF